MTEHHGYTPQKDALARRMKRIEGQVRGIAKMIDDDKYCIDILTQVSAATAALHAVSINLLEDTSLTASSTPPPPARTKRARRSRRLQPPSPGSSRADPIRQDTGPMFAVRRPRGSRTRDTPLRPRRPTGRRARAKKAGDMTTTTITVSGMTCGHCVASVKEEIGRCPGSPRSRSISTPAGIRR